jgi:hypothetical protein
MAKRVNDEESKVFDISKPGKGKVVATSRPIITISDIAKDISLVEGEDSKKKASSSSHKVIQPLTLTAESSDGTSGEAINVTVNTVKKPEATPEEPLKNFEPTDSIDATSKKTKLPTEPEELKKTEAVSEPKENPQEPVKKEDVHTEGVKQNEEEMSDSAAVDAVASAITTKRETAKLAEEKAKQDAAVEALIESKKYFVPIGHSSRQSTNGHKRSLTVLLILLLVLVGAYLVIDANVIKIGISLPIDLIR